MKAARAGARIVIRYSIGKFLKFHNFLLFIFSGTTRYFNYSHTNWCLLIIFPIIVIEKVLETAPEDSHFIQVEIDRPL